MKKRWFKILIFFLVVFILAFLVWNGLKEEKIQIPFWNQKEKDVIEELEKMVPEMMSSSDVDHGDAEIPEAAEEINEAADSREGGENISMTELAEPLTAQPVYPSDIYSESGTRAEFQCYVPDAVSYLWEYYDTSAAQWVPAEDMATSEKEDELYRRSSFYSIDVTPESDGTMIRCSIIRDGQDPLVKTATLYLIEEITDIFIDDADYPSGYLNIQDIPVTVTYRDDRKETLQGLNGLLFVDRNESTEYTDGVSGNRIETVTTVYTECRYIHLGSEEKELLMRYRINDPSIEKEALFCGKDTEPPDISEIAVSDYEVSAIDMTIPVTVMISATDNDTPAASLFYAFLPEGQEVTEEDWRAVSSFEVDITQNGVWIAYCRDQSGNICTEEKKIIAVDQKAPVISELYLAESTWCQKNRIIVTAADELEIWYRYCCPETGEDSGWIAENTFEVSHNGVWEIRVKDAVENISEIQELTVSNIDTVAPVIISITEGE